MAVGHGYDDTVDAELGRTPRRDSGTAFQGAYTARVSIALGCGNGVASAA